jgi:hypothetical protein
MWLRKKSTDARALRLYASVERGLPRLRDHARVDTHTEPVVLEIDSGAGHAESCGAGKPESQIEPSKLQCRNWKLIRAQGVPKASVQENPKVR